MADPVISSRAVGIVQVAAFGGCEAAVAEHIDGLRGRTDIVEIGPKRWWLISDEGTRIAADRFDAGSAAIVDLSSSRIVVSLRHARWREVVAKGCATDLSSARFLAESYAATTFARCNVLLRAPPGMAGCDLYVVRSCAEALRRWLADALVEFGDA